MKQIDRVKRKKTEIEKSNTNLEIKKSKTNTKCGISNYLHCENNSKCIKVGLKNKIHCNVESIKDWK